MSDDDRGLSHHGVDDATGMRSANETMRLLLERSSCRSFSDRPIPEAVLEQILQAGIHAPTGGNLQPFSIIIVAETERKETLAHLNEEQMFMAEAPINLVFCIDWHRIERWAALESAPFAAKRSFRHFWISFQDTIIAAQNICTAADALGLGSVYIGTIMDRIPEHSELLGLPDGVLPVVILTMGYPKARPAPKRKLAREVLVHRERYRDLSDEALSEAFEAKYPALRREVTPERLAVIEEVARAVDGPAIAERCLETVRRNGYINAAQYYFALHYRADQMAAGTGEFLDVVRRRGFGWFDR
jgi:nitroreductase